jgi:hypothetical protein
MGTNISEEPAMSLKMKATGCSESLIPTSISQNSGVHIPEGSSIDI